MGASRFAPPHDVYGNVHFSPFGVFAYWIVTPPDRPLANETAAAAAALAHRKLTDMLVLDVGFAGTSTLKDPEFIYSQQLAGVDTTRFPLAEQIAYGRRLEAEATGPRFTAFWMWVRLDTASPAGSPVEVARRRLTGSGMFAPRPSAANLEHFFAEMTRVEKMIPAAFAPIRPSSPQIRWFYRRQQTLGAVDEPLPLPGSADSAVLGHQWQPQVKGDEHGFESVLRVRTFDDGLTETFQINAVVTSMPPGGIYYPASDITSVISSVVDSEGDRVAADWVQRPFLLPLRKANRRTQKSYRKIDEQHTQQAGRRSTHRLSESEEALAAFEEELSIHPREAEIGYTTVFTVGADSERKVRLAFEALREELAGLRIELAAPVGQQKRLYQSLRPGAVDLSVRNAFAQFTSRTGWARHIPLTTTRFGDAAGRAIGLNRMSGDLDFVFLDTRGEARRVMSGGMIVGGDPRKGKTHFQMFNAAEEATSGACVVMFDASPNQQWRRFAEAVPGSAAVNLARAQYTADPLVTMRDRAAGELVADELCRIAGEAPGGEAATELRLLLNRRRFTSTGELLEYLSTEDAPPPLRAMSRRLLSWSTTACGEALFGRVNPATGRREPLPRLALDEVNLLVVETGDLGLPTEKEVEAARAGGEALTAQQLMGQSVMSMFAVYVRHVFYGRKSRDVLGFDEGWRTVGVKVLKDLVFEILRTGPAANVDVWLNSQKPWRDFGDIDDDLARIRVCFAVEGEREAQAAVEWIGIDPQRYPGVVETLRTGLSPRTQTIDAFHRSSGGEVIDRDRMGECLMRTGDGGHAWVKTFEMVFPEWEAAADTRPVLT